jgi:hypothetical protein
VIIAAPTLSGVTQSVTMPAGDLTDFINWSLIIHPAFKEDTNSADSSLINWK